MKPTPPPAQAEEILAAVRELLSAAAERRDGGLRFELRVAARLMGLLERELAQGGAAAQAEREGLRALLPPAGAGQAPQALELELELLRAQLGERIARGELGLGDAELMDHLWRSALTQIAIDSPDYAWHAPPQSGS
jgi:hypothetical protein